MNYNSSMVKNGILAANIHTTGKELLAKKLDLNNGIGDGSDKISIKGENKKSVYGLRLANFKVAVDSSSVTGEIHLRDIVGIPDRMFGKVDNAGNTDSHLFLYMPVTNPKTGKTWLNNNLGADYTNLNSSVFDLMKQAQHSLDEHAFGSKLQWGRVADGHELIDWTGGLRNPVNINNRTIQRLSENDTPAHPYRINAYSYYWRANRDYSIWGEDSTTNAVCPQGFKVPTANEMKEEMDSWDFYTQEGALESPLRLTLSARTATVYPHTYGAYWTSTQDETYCRDGRCIERLKILYIQDLFRNGIGQTMTPRDRKWVRILSSTERFATQVRCISK
jgi:hypothetical protein